MHPIATRRRYFPKVQAITAKSGAKTSLTWDGNGQRTAAINPAGKRVTYGYDTNGLATGIDNLDSQSMANRYDANGNRIVSISPLGRRTSFTFNGSNQQTAVTSPLGNTSHSSYDPMNRLLSQADPLGNTTSYRYDQNGQRIATTNPLGQTTTSVYDDNQRLTATIDPLGNQTGNGRVSAGMPRTRHSSTPTFRRSMGCPGTFSDRSKEDALGC